MKYQEYKPSQSLTPYVKCYYTIECDASEVVNDHAFATGCIELMFTLQGKPWQTATTELWGQIINPLAFRSIGKCELFGIRIFPATASFLFRDNISVFNDKVLDLSDVLGKSVKELRERLQEKTTTVARIALVDHYLQSNLNPGKKIDLIRRVMTEITHKDFFDNIDNVAARYEISSRYLQKVFVENTGLSPKLYARINRFQNSLTMMRSGKASLTDVSYESGYFDQSHFIREFKSFTGVAPSAFFKNQ